MPIEAMLASWGTWVLARVGDWVFGELAHGACRWIWRALRRPSRPSALAKVRARSSPPSRHLDRRFFLGTPSDSSQPDAHPGCYRLFDPQDIRRLIAVGGLPA